MVMVSKSVSTITGFYKKTIQERLEIIKNSANLSSDDVLALSPEFHLAPPLLDSFIENVVGHFSLPLGIASNFLINGEDFFVPMAIEESSVVAAASYGAKLVRSGGGFTVKSSSPIMTGQIQLLCPNKDYDSIIEKLKTWEPELINLVNMTDPILLSLGGGAEGCQYRIIPEIFSIIIHLDVDVRDAMGANTVNTMCEAGGAFLKKKCQESNLSCEPRLMILTNLTEKRMVRATGKVPFSSLSSPTSSDSSKRDGHFVAQKIVEAFLFAKHDIYRASTHNKGIMNGIDPIAIATGNDWRAIEAGAHAFAARSGSYLPLSEWSISLDSDDESLMGTLEIPLAVGVIGGVTKLHPTAQASLKLLKSPSAQRLSEIICAVGLAQNLAALKSLATEGIQKGHMKLHQKNIDLFKNLSSSKKSP